MDTVEVRQCVITTLTRRGSGKDRSSPVRVITEVWDAETGARIAGDDPDLVYNCATDKYTRLGENNETTLACLCNEGKIQQNMGG